MDVESIRSDCLSSRRQPKTYRGANDLCFKIGGKIFLAEGA